MIDRDMIDYVKMSRRSGKSDEQIKTSLLPGGWKTEDIEEAIKIADTELKKDSAVVRNLNIEWGWLRIFAAIVLVIAAIVMAAGKVYRNVSRNIQVDGNNVQISFGKNKLSAYAMPETDCTFIINNGSHTGFGDGFFAAWTMEQANSLKAAYGDFTHCNSPGMQAGMNSLNHLIVFAADDSVRAKLNHLIKVSQNEPVVKFRVSQLKVKGQTYNNAQVIWDDQSGQTLHYLVKDVTIVKENYNK